MVKSGIYIRAKVDDKFESVDLVDPRVPGSEREAFVISLDELGAKRLAMMLISAMLRAQREEVTIVAAIVTACGGKVRVPRNALMDCGEYELRKEHDFYTDETVFSVSRRKR